MPKTLSNFKEQQRNANRHTPRGMGALQESIQKDGWIGALTVAADGESFDGSARIEVGTQAGFGDAIIVKTDGTKPLIHIRTDIPHADDERAVRLGLAANRVAALNLNLDPLILQQLSTKLDLSSLWNPEELTALFAGQNGQAIPPDDPGPQLDKAEELRKKWDVSPGQLWALGDHRLLCGDSTKREDVERVMGGEMADLILTDPPYGMHLDTSFKNSLDNPAKHIKASRGYAPIIVDDEDFDPRFLMEVFRSVKEQFWWGADYYRKFLPPGGSWLVWDKRDGMEVAWKAAEFELCWSKSSHHRKIIRHRWFGLIGTEQEDQQTRFHPAQKPLGVYENLLSEFSQEQAIVVDFFLGSGTCLIACERLHRRCRAIEISAAYTAVALQRWADMTSKEPQLL